MAHRGYPENFNAFGYDPRGRVANIAGLMFGENWRPDQQGIPRHDGPEVAPPRYGPPADYQRSHLPSNFIPRLPHDGYLGALQYQRREGPWAYYPLPPVPLQAQRPPSSIQLRHEYYLPDGLDPQQAVLPNRTRQQQQEQQNIRERPNREVNPGVFRMVAVMNTPTVQKQFTIESDIPYVDLRSRACANLDLDPSNAKLGYRISGAEGPKTLPSSFDSEDDHLKAMDRICKLISRSRTKEYGIEVVNLQPAPKPVTTRAKSRKRTRDDDIPTSTEPSLDGMIADEFKRLKAHLRCEACKGHCHVMSSGHHQRLDYKDMSYWAKQNALGNSDIYTPPNALTLDHRPKRLRANPYSGFVSGPSGPEIHVHLEGLGDALRLGGSGLSNCKSTNTMESTLQSNPVLSVEISPKRDAAVSPISNICSPRLFDILDTLEKSQPGSNFMDMLIPLQEAGVHTLDEVVFRGEALLVEWTGLPPHQVAALYSYSRALHVAKPALLEEPESNNDETDEGDGVTEQTEDEE